MRGRLLKGYLPLARSMALLAIPIAALCSDSNTTGQPSPNAEFQFVRLSYTGATLFGGRERWLTDWPDAEQHLIRGIKRLTRIDTADEGHYLSIMDDSLFDYPWIYAVEVGNWVLTDEETARLREYLLRGGFLVVDDFWGPEQWEIFRQTMDRVLPGRPITDISRSDSVMNLLYNIQEQDLTFIPGSRHLRRGYRGSIEIEQPAGTSPAWRALHDDRQRMVVAINFNTDMADGWEFADAPYYPEKMTTLAYRYGINYVVYAMTH